MLSVRTSSWKLVASVVGVLAASAVTAVQAQEVVQWGRYSADRGDRLTAASRVKGDEYVLQTSGISVGDIETLQTAQKRQDETLESLKSRLDAQTRTLDEFRRKEGSSSSSSDSQLADLKRTVADQKSTIDRLKSDISDQKRSYDDLKRTVDNLSSKVK
ncbi:hypothetical protein [Pseudomonas sp. SDO5271_S396]